MLKLVSIDLASADVALFENYERKVLARLERYGGRVELCARSTDGLTETHILYFPDASSFDEFLSDSVRSELQDEWMQSGVVATVSDVEEVDYLEHLH